MSQRNNGSIQCVVFLNNVHFYRQSLIFLSSVAPINNERLVCFREWHRVLVFPRIPPIFSPCFSPIPFLLVDSKSQVRVSQWFQDGRGWGRLLWSLHTTQVSEARTIYKLPVVHVLLFTSVWMWPPRSPGSSPPRPR